MKEAKQGRRDELRPGYERANFPKGFTRGKYTARFAEGSNIVMLDPDRGWVARRKSA
jgi:hypothetical protein